MEHYQRFCSFLVFTGMTENVPIASPRYYNAMLLDEMRGHSIEKLNVTVLSTVRISNGVKWFALTPSHRLFSIFAAENTSAFAVYLLGRSSKNGARKTGRKRDGGRRPLLAPILSLSFLIPLLPPCRNESRCETISYENDFRLQVHFHANLTHFHLNGFALRLVLKQRHKGTRKWPIRPLFFSLCPK